jgi:hypothetical protein
MKSLRLFFFGLLAFFALLLTPRLHAQDQADTTKSAAASNDTLGTPLLNEFNKDFDEVFKATKAGLEAAGYTVNYASKKRKQIETEFRQLANEDTFDDVMDKYGDVPYMRSPGWTTGRVKLFVTLEEIDSNRTAVKVLGQLSGYEERFTNRWHYWRSNGKLEDEAMNAIVQAVEGTKE